MRHTHLLAFTAAALAASATAGAQETRSPSADRAREGNARTFSYRTGDEGPRAALGVSTTATGTPRDTIGLLITSVTKGSPAEKAGLEEGNRLSAINGVSLRASAADLEDYEASGTLSRRLVRELGKLKPGDEVELRVYRDGRSQTMKVRTADSDSLFRRSVFREVSRADMDDQPAIGIVLGSPGTRRDTLGVLVISVLDSTPAARAGLEEGNRIAAINGINLRVAREDAGDPGVGDAKSQRLRREVAKLKPNDNVSLRVYGNGQWRDVTLKVARSGDLPRSSRMGMGGGSWYFPGIPPRPAIAPMPPMRVDGVRDVAPIRFEIGPEVRERMRDGMRDGMRELRVELDRLRPELDRMKTELPRALEKIRMPEVRVWVGGSETV